MKRTLKLLLLSTLVIVMSLTCLTACDVEEIFEDVGDFFDDIFDEIGGSSEGTRECEHDWYVEYSERSTCTYNGYEVYVCKHCGQKREESLPLGEHNLVVESGTPATCVSTGTTDRIYCAFCGVTTQYPEYIDAKGHTNIEILEAVAATCTENGLTEGKKCLDCDTIIEAQETIYASHTPEVVKGYEATCTEDGLSDGTVCSVCGDVLANQYIIEAGHLIEYIPAVSVTCTENGYTEGEKCSRCNVYIVEPEIIYAEGHVEYVYSAGYEATCTRDGISDTIWCEKCWQKVRGGDVIPAGHKEEAIAGVEATCSSTGLTEGKKCTSCGEITVEQEVIPMTAHTVVDISGFDATCTSNGLSAGKACSKCGNPTVTQHTIAATGHVFGDDGKCTGCDIEVTEGLAYISDETSGALTYKVSGFMDGYGVDVEIIVIPSTHEGAPVVGINEGAFDGCETVKRVILPATIVSVGENAFNGCTSLEFIECSDFEQAKQWNSAWLGNCTIVKIKAPSYNGKTPYEIYLEAMNATQHNLNRYVMNSTNTVSMSYNSTVEKMMETTTVQKQYYNDFYFYTKEVDYGSSTTHISNAYYVGGYYYDTANSMKLKMSWEAWMDMMTLNRGDMPELTEKHFKNVEFTMSPNGNMHLYLILDADYLHQIMVEQLGPDAESLQLSDTEYNYTFTADGIIESYTADVSMVISGGYFITHSDVEFSQVNTFSGISAPAGCEDYTDTVKNYYCRNGHTEVNCDQVDATCFGDGWTAYSYCKRCYEAIKKAEIIEASHNFVNGECIECGIFYYTNTSKDLAYELNSDGSGYILVGIGDCKDTVVYVPEQVYGRPVITVKADAFNGTNVEMIYIAGNGYSSSDFTGCEDTRELWAASK